jgi:hypothetical protein
MFEPAASSIVAAKPSGPRRRRAQRHAPGPIDGAVTGAVLVRAISATPKRFALEAGRAPETSGNKLDKPPQSTAKLPIKAVPNERFRQLRRGEASQSAEYEILAPMASNAESDAAASADGLSAFIARVLDQLALSAWFPAAFLTAGIAVILEFRSTKSASVPDAVAKLTAHSLQALVIMIPLLVIATVITQAFSFEAIRALEGYWRRRGLTNFACKLMIMRHLRRKNAIIERGRLESANAFRAAVSDVFLRDDAITGRVVKAVAAELSGKSSEAPKMEGNELELYVKTLQNWRKGVDPWRLATIDRLNAEQKCYPVDSRILPTKLGNLIRATEDDLDHAGDDVQSFVLRQRNRVSQRIQIQHDQFRTRLDMYCTLVFVCVVLMIITPIALAGRVDVIAVAVTTGSFAVMAVASYLAAIASAGGYCTALRQMDEAVRDQSDN